MKRGQVVLCKDGSSEEFSISVVFDDGVKPASDCLAVVSLRTGCKGHVLVAKVTPYDGPTYEKGGRKFVQSPEPCRFPKKGEWFYSEGIGKPVVALSSWIAMPPLDTEGHGWTRRILLEVPALPEEVEERVKCDLCDGKGELLTICERCHGTGELTKPDGICPTCKGGIL